MPVIGFDHAAIPAEDLDEMLRFYKALGFGVVGEDEWRSGKQHAVSVVFGENKINLHAPELWKDNPRFNLRGPAALPGCGDFCFVWAGTVEDAAAAIRAARGEVIEGPVARVGGRAHGTAQGMSVYTRDPDGNLLEFIVYPAG